MISFDDFYDWTKDTPLKIYLDDIRLQLDSNFFSKLHGDCQSWLSEIQNLPPVIPDCLDLDNKAVTIGSDSQLNKQQTDELIATLRCFLPWRKGPWNLFGIEIDTEWRSDLKWQRIEKHLGSLTGKYILDVGCGNSYYGFRMLSHDPRLVLGIDPTQLFLMQFLLFKSFTPELPLFQLPLRDEDLPQDMECFDTVFSMGVIYHRRDPMQHLVMLWNSMVHGGELILESLIINEGQGENLQPESRYAKMRNVWNIPSVAMLIDWIKAAGFTNVEILDITKTTISEQRVTDWMEFESLEHFLDPENQALTIEGHPAPVRAIIKAIKE